LFGILHDTTWVEKIKQQSLIDKFNCLMTNLIIVNLYDLQ